MMCGRDVDDVQAHILPDAYATPLSHRLSLNVAERVTALASIIVRIGLVELDVEGHARQVFPAGNTGRFHAKA